MKLIGRSVRICGHEFMMAVVPETMEGHADYVHQPDVIDALLRFVKPGDVVIDAGANLGFFTLLMSRLVGPSGLVLAFEPERVAFDNLQQNLIINRMHNVVAQRAALWDRDDALVFYPTRDNGYASFIRYEEASLDGYPVLAHSLDSALRHWPQPAVIKIDAEGADGKVLQGAQRAIKAGVRALIVEFNVHLMECLGPSETEVREFMLGHGYDCFVLMPGYVPTYLPPMAKVALDPEAEPKMLALAFNVLFCKRAQVDELWARPLAA